MLRRSLLLAAFGLLFVSCPFVQADEHAPKRHVIVMVSDGGGFNTFAATSMFQGKWDSAKDREGTGHGPGGDDSTAGPSQNRQQAPR